MCVERSGEVRADLWKLGICNEGSFPKIANDIDAIFDKIANNKSWKIPRFFTKDYQVNYLFLYLGGPAGLGI